MEFQAVSSSNIRGIAWENETLWVEFTNGSTYKYDGVPESEYEAFLEAGSPGQFFAAHIKSNYPFTRQ